MAERRKTKSRKSKDEGDEKPSKEEYAIAKHLKFNMPQKEAKLVGMDVKIFIASEAVNLLLDSKWASGKNKADILFTNRQSCVNFMDRLLQKNLFHRAARSEKKKKPPKAKDMEDDAAIEEKGKKKSKKEKEKEEKEKKDDDKKDVDKKDGDKKEKDEKEKEKEKEKKKKKIKLKMHDDQIFLDGDEVYVWIYDPVPFKTFVIGLLLVIGAIAVCLFPLWPPEVRQGVYYLSLGGIGFVGFILSLVVIRSIVFCVVWMFTAGHHHLWILPNLTEDVGFFESFQPWYKHDYFSKRDQEKADDKKEIEKEEKVDKENGETQPKNGETQPTEKEEVSKKDISDNSSEGEGELDQEPGYEMVDKEELTQSQSD